MKPQQSQPPKPPKAPKPPRTKDDKINLLLNIAIGFSIFGILVAVGLWIYGALNNNSISDKVDKRLATILQGENNLPVTKTIKSTLGFEVGFNLREFTSAAYADNNFYQIDDLAIERPYDIVRIKASESLSAARSPLTLTEPELRIVTSRDKDFWSKLQDAEMEAKEQAAKSAGKKDGTTEKPDDKKAESEKAKTNTEDGKKTDGDKKGGEVDSSSKVETGPAADVDRLIKITTEGKKSKGSTKSSKPRDVKISDRKFKYVEYEFKNDKNGVTSRRLDKCYFAKIEDRPYTLCVNNIRSQNFSATSGLQDIISKIKFSKAKPEDLISDKEKTAVDTETDQKDEEEIKSVDQAEINKSIDEAAKKNTIEPSKFLYDTGTFSILAKNQPAVVRVGSIYCADINLKSNIVRGAEANLTNACYERLGSGFFVDSSGIVATSGSNVSVRPSEILAAYVANSPDGEMSSRLDRILKFMYDARLITDSDAKTIALGVAERNQDYVEKVYMLGDLIPKDFFEIKNSRKSFAVQTSSQPIVARGDRGANRSFSFSKDVLEAEILTDQYSSNMKQAEILDGKPAPEDMALLKIKNPDRVFPATDLSTSYNVPDKAKLLSAGFFSRTGYDLNDSQASDQPVLFEGQSINSESINSSLIINRASLPMSSGFAGAPIFGRDSSVHSVAAFNNLNCPDDDCFAGGASRSVLEIVNLAKDKRLTLGGAGQLSGTWSDAINNMLRGDYSTSAKQFASINQSYPQNQMAGALEKYSVDMKNSDKDTSLQNLLEKIGKLCLIIFVILLFVSVIVKVFKRVFSKSKPVTQYGILTNGQFIDNSNTQYYSAVPSLSGQNYSQVRVYPSNNQNYPPNQNMYPPNQSAQAQYNQNNYQNSSYPPNPYQNQPPNSGQIPANYQDQNNNQNRF